MGGYSRAAAENPGHRHPVYPVKGYSLTVPITRADAAPVSTVMDETYKVAITPLLTTAFAWAAWPSWPALTCR